MRSQEPGAGETTAGTRMGCYILKHQEKECKKVLETMDKVCTTIILMLQQNHGFKD
jgi:hypothetical protein